MLRRGSRSVPAVALTIAAVGLATSAQPTQARLQNPDYVGNGVAQERELRIELKVKPREGTDRILIQAARIPLFCDDDRDRRLSPRPFPAKLNARGRFEKVNYFDERTSDQSMYWYGGRLLSETRAKGFVFYWSDPFDGPVGDSGPDCSTHGKVRWTAKR